MNSFRTIECRNGIGLDDLADVVACLRRGELVVIPTDTVYGVAADPRVAGAEARIFSAKKRPDTKPIPLLAGEVRQVESWGLQLSPAARELARRYWPGALTMVLPSVADAEVCEGVRIPAHAVALDVIRAVGSMLRVTSANISGEPPACTAQAALDALAGRVSRVLDAGPMTEGVPSTVIRVRAATVEVLREGAIPSREIMNAVQPLKSGSEI